MVADYSIGPSNNKRKNVRQTFDLIHFLKIIALCKGSFDITHQHRGIISGACLQLTGQIRVNTKCVTVCANWSMARHCWTLHAVSDHDCRCCSCDNNQYIVLLNESCVVCQYDRK